MEKSSKVIKSWLKYNSMTEFPVENIPFGVFKSNSGPHCATRIGDKIIDLNQLTKLGYFKSSKYLTDCFEKPTLNLFMSLNRTAWIEARKIIQSLFRIDTTFNLQKDNEKFVSNVNEVEMCLPAKIGDYTDFYSSRYHATNVGKMFRPNQDSLKENWLHLPVGYHGRASSIIISGTPLKRPNGQIKPKTSNDSKPIFGPSRSFDFELEMAFFFGGKSNKLGEPILIEKAYDNIFGLVLMNDWSARDIQKWEYEPLGPFNGKNFGTTISPWIITMEALEEFKIPLKYNEPLHSSDPEILPYLKDPNLHSFNIKLQIDLQPKNNPKALTTLSNSNLSYLYWSFEQQLAHHTSTGCNFQPGDLCGSGTISGPEKGSFGSMLEICWAGKYNIPIKDDTTRKFIKDGDTILIRGYCQGNGYRIGFGECDGEIFPANKLSAL